MKKGIVGGPADVRNHVLEQVPREAELRKEEQIDFLDAGPAHEIQVDLEVFFRETQGRIDLTEPDTDLQASASFIRRGSRSPVPARWSAV